MSRRKKNQPEQGGGEEWLQTYADTITLVLTFFVLLYSFSTVDAAKFQQLTNSLQSIMAGKSSNGILEFSLHDGEVPIVGQPVELGPKNPGNSNEMYNKVKGFIEENDLNGTVQIKRDSRGIIMELKDNVLFDIGKAEIKEQSKEILNKINKLISSIPNEIIVEGHTDNVPIHNYRYPSNWELSTQRAVNVLKYFVQIKGQNPGMFQAAGYGEYRPIAQNNTYENRAKNRRVNILITASKKEKK
ncbi:OmpA family protein [Clostridium aestuarii]|uniref:OmpA family protein n=1 Tax=Clostridium aestuarii TaxID=338193 RepID=A0ABT4CXJ2_9CLOT|nr:OmpA family protein [Clostridium aestuarii]MCY6483691.1 OmpA family protein [Clostridium aestuarii]